MSGLFLRGKFFPAKFQRQGDTQEKYFMQKGLVIVGVRCLHQISSGLSSQNFDLRK